MFPVIALIILFTNFFANGARILAIIPSPAYSHQHAFHPIWRELSLRGHHVTLITTDPVRDPELTNLTQIDVSFAYKYMNHFYDMMHNLTMLNTANYLQNTLKLISQHELKHPEVQKLIQTKNKFDLVISESIFPEFLAFGEIYKCPTILVSSLELQSVIHIATGNPSHPVLHPEFVLPFYGQLTFKERLISTLYQVIVNYIRLNKSFPEKEKLLIAKNFGNAVPPIIDMLKNVDMLFLNVNPVLHDVRALGPTTVTFDGVHLKPLRPLPKVRSMLRKDC